MTVTAPTGPFLPTNELVAVAWLSQRVPGLDAAQVATTLPRDTEAWALGGFVQVQAIPGGVPSVDIPVRHPVFQVDCWATSSTTKSSSSKLPWNLANYLAEIIRDATESDDARYGAPVTLRDGYLGARVQAAYLVSEPQRVLNDPSGFARFTLDLAIDWVRQ